MKKKKVDPVKIHNENIFTLTGLIVTEVTGFFTENADELEGISYQIQNLESNPFNSRCPELPFARAKISLSRDFPTIFFDLFFNNCDAELYARVDFDETKSEKFTVCRYDIKKKEFQGKNLDYTNQKFLTPECLKILEEILNKFTHSHHKTRS